MSFTDAANGDLSNLTPLDLWEYASIELNSGEFPTKDTYCGDCWEKLYKARNNPPGERIIDWLMMEKELDQVISSLNYYNADKKHEYYKFLQEKLTLARVYNRANLRDDIVYSDLEVTALSLVQNGKRLEIPKDVFLGNYKDLKEMMKNFEGKYSKNGFTFPYEASDVIQRIRNKETTNLKKKYQFFGTPDKLAYKLCEMSFDPMLNKSVKILEPQAGQGAIISQILKWFNKEAVNINIGSLTAIELMKENYKYLDDNFNTDEVGMELLQMDFLEYDKYINYFDYVIGNPPFSKGQDILHFKKMYEVCKPGGVVTCIMSTTWLQNSQKKFKEFREWLGIEKSNNWKDEIMIKSAAKGQANYSNVRIGSNGNDENVRIETFPAGAFKESGTNVITCVVQINKNNLSGFEHSNDQLTLF